MSFIPGRLDSQEIKKKLKKTNLGKFKLSDVEITSILQRFWYQDAYNSLISYPEYFELLVAFLKKIGTADFTRLDFISFALEQLIVDKETLRYLMDFSLVMELLQSNEVEPEKLLDIFNKLEIKDAEKKISHLKTIFILEEKTIDDKLLVGFKHHSLQECLVAKLILDSKNPLSLTKDLVLLKQEGLVTIKPSWYNVISFLLESERGQESTEWLIALGKDNPKIVEEGYSNALSRLNPEKTPTKIQEKVFDLIYKTYQERSIWLPLWTRQSISQLCQPKNLKTFRNDIRQTKDDTETFVRRGNVADIISRLLENNSPLMTEDEKGIWKPKLIEFANDNNENGVLQRHALSALSTYKDSTLITKVKKAFEHQDKLVREAFIQFCYETNPNDVIAIEYFVKGIKGGIDIYGRYGIYEISSKAGVKKILSYFAEDVAFLKRFLDRESIFNKEDKKGDQVIVDRIKNNLDTDMLRLIKNVVKTAYQSNDIHHQERSYFLEQLVTIIFSQDKNYIFETLKDIQDSAGNKRRFLFNYEDLFAQILRPEHLERFFDEVKRIDDGNSRMAEMVIYKAKHRRKKAGESLYKKAVELKLIEPLTTQPQSPPSIGENLYREFLKLLEPQEGKYVPAVFGYYIRSKKELEPLLTKENKQRLAKLALEEGLKKIDSKKIQVTIDWDSGESGRSFKISNVSSYYGDLLRTSQSLLPNKKVGEYRQNVINFIPFAFSEDQQTILELTEPIQDEELKWVNQVYLNKDGDIRYLIPSSYIYAVKFHIDKNLKLDSALPVLKSFVEDEKMAINDREYALRQIEGFISKEDKQTKKFLEKLFTNYKGNTEKEKLAIISNKILINVYRDKDAITWRFKQLKNRLVAFEEPEMGLAHWVGPIEEELDSKWFARPLINLDSDKYIENFLDVLDFSFKQIPLADDNNYWPYIKYLWAVVIAYFEGLREQGSFEPLKKLESWIEKYSIKGTNWFIARTRELSQTYELYIGAIKDVAKAVDKVKKLSHE